MEDARFTAKTRQELAQDLGINVSTLRYKLKKLGLRTTSGLLIPDEIVRIYQALGYKSLVPKEFLNSPGNTLEEDP